MTTVLGALEDVTVTLDKLATAIRGGAPPPVGRDALIMAMSDGGMPRREVAERFSITAGRVSQIVAANRAAS